LGERDRERSVTKKRKEGTYEIKKERRQTIEGRERRIR
jgi:hypothetical protein